MLDWMIGNCNLFGLPCQHWMLVFGGGFAAYLIVLIVAPARQDGAR